MAYYLIVVMGGIEPNLHGPWDTAQEQCEVAKILRAELDEDDVLLWLDADSGGIPEVGVFTAGFFDETDGR